MYVQVIYYNEKIKGYTGRSYTYRTDLELKESDKVLVPVGSQEELKRAMVVATHVSLTVNDAIWVDKIKSVTQYDYADMQEVM